MQIKCNEVTLKFKNNHVNDQHIYFSGVPSVTHLLVERQDGFLLIRFETGEPIPSTAPNSSVATSAKGLNVITNYKPAQPSATKKLLMFSLSDLHEIMLEGVY